MKAIVTHQYGSPDVLHLAEVEKPTPKDDQVLIAVQAASVNAGDWHLLRGDPFLIRLMYGLRKPKFAILGTDVAGRIEAVGRNVTQFQPGDKVFGNLSGSGFGAFAEYAVAPQEALAPMPSNLSFEQAAAVPSASVTALQALRDHGEIRAGKKVLINGASGGVGSYAVQIAKALGADVTGVCSTRKMATVRALGADHVIDYTQEDFTQQGARYDLIMAANGYNSIAAYRRALTPQGIYVMSGGEMKQMMQAMLLGPLFSMGSEQKMGNMLVHPTQADLIFMAALIEAGKVVPMIDRTYPLDEVADAIRYLEAGHAQGKVIITVAAEEATKQHDTGAEESISLAPRQTVPEIQIA